jgi:Soluble lytic murein transglycosylase and related regulatory proteins (some contain LysM/invasin domains)
MRGFVLQFLGFMAVILSILLCPFLPKATQALRETLKLLLPKRGQERNWIPARKLGSPGGILQQGVLILTILIGLSPVLWGTHPEVTACAQAAQAYKAQEFEQAYQHAMPTTCPTLFTLARWRQLRQGQGQLSLQDYITFVATYGNWPWISEIRRQAEHFITKDTSPQQILQWFSQGAPKTFKALKLYYEALRQTGQKTKSLHVLEAAWLTMPLKEGQEQEIGSFYGKGFSDALNQQRFMALLERNNFEAAARQLRRCAAKDQAVLKVKLALRQKDTNALALYAKLPAKQRNSVGLVEEVLRYYQQQEDTEGYAFYQTHKQLINAHPEQFWRLRYIMARDALIHKNYQQVFECLGNHGLSAGDPYVRVEWLLGFVAHRFLKQHHTALKHLKNAHHHAVQETSKSRLAYWIAETYEALGQPEEALAWRKKAAQFPKTFYGQLAADKLGQPLELRFSPLKSDEAIRKRLLQNAYFQKLLVLKALGDYGNMAPFGFKIFAGLTSKAEKQTFLALIHQFMPELIYDLARLAGGNYSYRETYPYRPVKNAEVNSHLINAIVRKESGFNPHAISPVGALGLMQLMPETAQKIAEERGETLEVEQLLKDPELNMRYGAYYFARKLEAFEGSIEITLAGYNAGPGNARKWLERYGDPRKAEIDLLTWIELIPFTETRTYIQRVSENYRVYQILQQ